MSGASLVATASSLTTGCTTSIEADIPGIAASRILLAGYITRNVGTPVTHVAGAGWTAITSASSGTTGVKITAYYRAATGAENSTCTFSISTGSANQMVTVISSYSGGNTACPFDVAGSADNGVESSMGFAQVTTTAACEMIAYIGGAVGGLTVTTPGGVTEQEEVVSTGANNVTGWLGTELKVTAGTSSSRTALLSGSQRNAGLTIAITAGSVAGAGPVSASTASSLGIPGFDIQIDEDVTWTSILTDVLSGPGYSIAYGLPGNGPEDRVAKTGTLSLSLNNSSTNASGLQGYYSPGHANARTGFEVGEGIQAVFQYSGSTFYKFRGRIDAIYPAPGVYRSRATQIQAVDWIDFAAKYKLKQLALQTNVTSDQVIAAVLGSMSDTPAASTLAVGQSEWPYALDTAYDESTTVLAEFQRVAQSDRGWIFIKGDSASGNHLVFQDHRTRLNPGSSKATLSNDMVSMRAGRTHGDTRNLVKMTAHPRIVDSEPTSILYTAFSYPVVPAGCTIVIEGTYTDPNQKAKRVGAASMVTPVAGTDYIGGTSPCGTELTDDLTITACLGANSFSASVTSAGSQSAYVGLQLRGAGIYDYSPISVTAEEPTRRLTYGRNELNVDMYYERSDSTACGMADYELYKWQDPRYAVDECTFVATGNDTLVKAALQVEPGDLITLTEGMTGISASQFFVQNVRLNMMRPNVLACTWGLLRRVDTTNYWQLDVDMLGQTSADSGSAYTVLGP